jgi:hypothetical protein
VLINGRVRALHVKANVEQWYERLNGTIRLATFWVQSFWLPAGSYPLENERTTSSLAPASSWRFERIIHRLGPD